MSGDDPTTTWEFLCQTFKIFLFGAGFGAFLIYYLFKNSLSFNMTSSNGSKRNGSFSSESLNVPNIAGSAGWRETDPLETPRVTPELYKAAGRRRSSILYK